MPAPRASPRGGRGGALSRSAPRRGGAASGGRSEDGGGSAAAPRPAQRTGTAPGSGSRTNGSRLTPSAERRRQGAGWDGTGWHGTAWHGRGRHGMAWHRMPWEGKGRGPKGLHSTRQAPPSRAASQHWALAPWIRFGDTLWGMLLRRLRSKRTDFSTHPISYGVILPTGAPLVVAVCCHGPKLPTLCFSIPSHRAHPACTCKKPPRVIPCFQEFN